MAGVFWLIAGPNGVGKTTYAFRNLETAERLENLHPSIRALADP